jgi:hypothetical protein
MIRTILRHPVAIYYQKFHPSFQKPITAYSNGYLQRHAGMFIPAKETRPSYYPGSKDEAQRRRCLQYVQNAGIMSR